MLFRQRTVDLWIDCIRAWSAHDLMFRLHLKQIFFRVCRKPISLPTYPRGLDRFSPALAHI